jgi:hypothetical protein
MPPQPLEYQGHPAIARPYGLIVLTLAGDTIAGITWFADTGVLRYFGLP